MMDDIDPETSKDKNKQDDADLARRLARFRSRVEAEGRKRSLKVIDRAIRETGAKADD